MLAGTLAGIFDALRMSDWEPRPFAATGHSESLALPATGSGSVVPKPSAEQVYDLAVSDWDLIEDELRQYGEEAGTQPVVLALFSLGREPLYIVNGYERHTTNAPGFRV